MSAGPGAAQRRRLIAPELARQPFDEYAEQWLRDRVLKVRTEELYRGLLKNHLLPTFGAMSIGEIDEAAVRRWRKERLETGRTAQRPFGPVTVAKAYRLLHAIFTTAADQAALSGGTRARSTAQARRTR